MQQIAVLIGRLFRIICYLDNVKFYELNINGSTSCTHLKNNTNKTDCVNQSTLFS